MIDIEKFNLSLITLLPLVTEAPSNYKTLLGKYTKALVNGYSGDINRPWLDNHVILIFDPELMDTYRVNTLEELPTKRLSKLIRIDGQPVIIYALEIHPKYSTDLKLILANRFPELKASTKIRMLSFWQQDESSSLCKLLFSKNYNQNSISEELLQEETYISQEYVITQGAYSL